jgi:diketogulonate reductase-like aldo/keto reductase
LGIGNSSPPLSSPLISPIFIWLQMPHPSYEPRPPRRKKPPSTFVNSLLLKSPVRLTLVGLIICALLKWFGKSSVSSSTGSLVRSVSKDTTISSAREIDKMPKIGYGTCCRASAKGEEVYKSTLAYLELGGRLIDTAMAYRNHAEIGRAVKKSGLERSEVWITSKVAPGKVSTYDACLDAIDGILDELDMTYLDLLLIHTPKLGKAPTVELWKCLIEAKRIGKTKSIGVSNFNQGEIEDKAKATGQMPAANEIQIHPWSSPSWKALTKWQKEHNIATIAYTSLGGSRFDSTKSSSTWPHEVSELAKKYNATEAQILLKWALQNGLAVIPGSGSKKHIKENLLSEANFVMTDEELLSIENSSVPHGWWDPKRGHSKYTDEEAGLPWAKRKNG